MLAHRRSSSAPWNYFSVPLALEERSPKHCIELCNASRCTSSWYWRTEGGTFRITEMFPERRGIDENFSFQVCYSDKRLGRMLPSSTAAKRSLMQLTLQYRRSHQILRLSKGAWANSNWFSSIAAIELNQCYDLLRLISDPFNIRIRVIKLLLRLGVGGGGGIFNIDLTCPCC